MALVKEDAVQRVEVHDGWIDLRAAISMSELLELAGDAGVQALQNPTPAMLQSIVQKFIVAWSYDDPVTPENVARLDMRAAATVFEEIQDHIWGDPKKGRSNGRVSRAGATPRA